MSTESNMSLTDVLSERIRLFVEAMTLSPETKAAYIGEFSHVMSVADGCGGEYPLTVDVPWPVIKDLMRAIHKQGMKNFPLDLHLPHMSHSASVVKPADNEIVAIVRREGGWYVTGVTWSSPWLTETIAELARDGDYDGANAAEATLRYQKRMV